MSALPFRRTNSGIELFVRMKPGASRDMIGAVETGPDGRLYLAVWVRAVPDVGAANKALIRLLADALRVPRTSLAIIKGPTARTKTLALTGNADHLEYRLSELVAANEPPAAELPKAEPGA